MKGKRKIGQTSKHAIAYPRDGHLDTDASTNEESDDEELDKC
jgi:hypothetical protein